MTLPRIPAVILKGGKRYTVPQMKDLYRRAAERHAKSSAK